jgi:hypothetical protein
VLSTSRGFTPGVLRLGGEVLARRHAGEARLANGQTHLYDHGIISAETVKAATWVYARASSSVALLA